ncbi:MAG: serine hydrolase [Nocardiopsaceae bacterium]|jgi:CubicO group peptidase (beta-lactamase class C family)|nr:serine hydrolase [Nocardiopsaceae bacterium]
MRRRQFLTAAAAAAAAAAVPALPGSAFAAPRPVRHGTSFAANPAASGQVTVTTSGGPTLSQLIPGGGPVLRYGTPESAGLIPQYANLIAADAAHGLQPGTGLKGHAVYPGEVVIAGHNGVVAAYAAAGYNLRYADQQGAELPPDQWIPTTLGTIYDLASLSKLFTSTVAVQLIEQGRLALGDTVGKHLPAFDNHGKGDITILQLLTHTSGLPPDPSPALWTYATIPERIAAVNNITPQAAAGTAYIYSDVNMIVMQFVAEAITGKTLDVLVSDGITKPLGMTDTMFNPPASLKQRVAAEEYQLTPDRGLVWGEVHDENAWALGGVAGHAGVFSTAKDMAIFCQAHLNGGRYGSARILSRDSVIATFTNYTQAFPGNDHGLGWELYQHWEEGALATPFSGGHTGFTGTSIAVDPTTQSFVLLLTNAVHPSRNWGVPNPERRQVAYDLLRAVAVRPAADQREWFGGMADVTTNSMVLPVTLPAGAQLSFSLWYDTEPGFDFFYLESSGDGGTTWQLVPFRIQGDRLDVTTPGQVSGYQGRQWLRATASLAGLTGATQLRWRYTTDPLYHGRGVYVDAIRITAADKTIFDDRTGQDAGNFILTGFVETTN